MNKPAANVIEKKDNFESKSGNFVGDNFIMDHSY